MESKTKTLNTAYKYRLYPTEKQKQFIDATINTCNSFYNSVLYNRIYTYYKNVLKYCGKEHYKIADNYKKLSLHRKIIFKKIISKKYNEYIKNKEIEKQFYKDLYNDYLSVKQFKEEKNFTFLKKYSASSLNHIIRHVDDAFKNFYSGKSEYPKFKKPNQTNSFKVQQNESCTTNRFSNNKSKIKKFYTIYFNKPNIKLKNLYDTIKGCDNIENLSKQQIKFYKFLFEKFDDEFDINYYNSLSLENKKNIQEIAIKNYNNLIKDDGGIKCIVHRKFKIIKNENNEIIEPKIKTCTISKTKSNKYYVSVNVEYKNVPITPLPEIDINTTLGIDIGLSPHLILSDPINGKNKINNFTKKGEKGYSHYLELCKKEKKLERIMSRKVNHRKIVRNKKVYKTNDYKNLTLENKRKKHKELNSKPYSKNEKIILRTYNKNREKIRLKLASVREQITNWKKDFWHNVSSEIVKNYDMISIEDINLQSFHKKKKVDNNIDNQNKKKSFKNSESWRKASISEFRNYLDYKINWANKRLVKINRFFPSTKTCHNCQYKNNNLKLSHRIWTCPNCSMELDRNINAAINLKNCAYNGINLSKK